MPLTKSKIQELKSQLKQQISHLPEEQKAEAEKQIEEMSPESLEVMLEQQRSQTQKIFRLIIEGQIPSVKIEENSDAIAVLSVKSISKGHTIVIPKSPVAKESELPKSAHELSEKISKKLIESLKASSTNIVPQKAFSEVILNVIPIYDKPLDLKSPTEDKSPEELEKVKAEINVIKIPKNQPAEKVKIEKPAPEKPIKLKRRIP